MTTTTGHKPDPVDVHVGRRIAARRQELGQSQSDLGEACRVSFQQIQKYEKGANRVSCSMLTRIATKQGVGPAWYFEGLELNQAEGQSVSPAIRSAADWLLTSEALNFALEIQPLVDEARRQCLSLATGAARMVKSLNNPRATLRDVADQRELIR